MAAPLRQPVVLERVRKGEEKVYSAEQVRAELERRLPLSGGGATLTVPAGALAATTTLSLSWGPASGGGYAYDSELFQFGPSGTSFATPAVASLPVTGDPQQAAFYWSDGQGSSQELIGRIL